MSSIAPANSAYQNFNLDDILSKTRRSPWYLAPTHDIQPLLLGLVSQRFALLMAPTESEEQGSLMEYLRRVYHAVSKIHCQPKPGVLTVTRYRVGFNLGY